MFIWDPSDHIRITFQTDHMAQAGDMGAAWGNHSLPGPMNQIAAVTAARNHDEGWRGWELAPEMDSGSGLPFDFRDVDRRTHSGFYYKGVEFVEGTDSRAAFLISMHATGLYLGRYGVDGLPVPAHDELPPHSRAFVEHEEARQKRLAEELNLSEEEIWHDYRLLQLWDRLSIVLCHGMAEATLGPIPMNAGTLGPVLVANRIEPYTVNLEPFPFAGDEQAFPVRTFVIPKRRYEAWDDLNLVMCSQPATYTNFRFIAGSKNDPQR